MSNFNQIKIKLKKKNKRYMTFDIKIIINSRLNKWQLI